MYTFQTSSPTYLTTGFRHYNSRQRSSAVPCLAVAGFGLLAMYIIVPRLARIHCPAALSPFLA